MICKYCGRERKVTDNHVNWFRHTAACKNQKSTKDKDEKMQHRFILNKKN